MTMIRLELEDVLFQLRAAQEELRRAISDEDDADACNELRKVCETLQDVILRIQLSKNFPTLPRRGPHPHPGTFFKH